MPLSGAAEIPEPEQKATDPFTRLLPVQYPSSGSGWFLAVQPGLCSKPKHGFPAVPSPACYPWVKV